MSNFKDRIPNLLWLGAALVVAWWVMESALHAFVFSRVPGKFDLLVENDPNEVWMRLVVAGLVLGASWVGERARQAERHLRSDADRLSRVARFVESVKRRFPPPVKLHASAASAKGLLHTADTAGGVASATRGAGDAFADLQELAFGHDEIGRLVKSLQDLSRVLDERFEELHALLQMTHEINMGLLLDDVLKNAYQMLRSVLPYDRLSVALLESEDRILRARWAKAEYPDVVLRPGYAAPMQGSSLQAIIVSGEPRIIDDLAAYFRAHPKSDSTHLMLAEGIHSSLTCPLISMGKPIGFIFFSSLNANTYRDVHVDTFKLIAGHLSVMVEKGNLYERILKERERSEHLLLNIMPARIVSRLRSGAKSVAEDLRECNILFIDMVDFTRFARSYPPERVVNVLENVFTPFDRLCMLHGVEKIKTIGDEYMVMSSRADGEDALRRLAEFALAALDSTRGMRYPDGRPIEIRVGMHSGQAVAGVIGQAKFAYDVWGDAVNVASRMQSSGVAGRIQVTASIYAALQGEYRFEERGMIDVKGVGPTKTYFLTGQADRRLLH